MPMPDVLAQLVDEVGSDASSLGLILHGSRATGDQRPDSDYDLIRVVTDEAYESRKAARTLFGRRESHDGPKADVLYQGVCRLKWLADNPDWWTATYITARIVVDKDGEIDRLVRAIIERGGDAAFAKVPEAYDSYLNSFVRSLKSWRRGDELGGRLHAAQSTLYLLPTLFGLERSWTPYFDSLTVRLPAIEQAQGWEPGYLCAAVLRLLETGDPTFQQQLQARIEDLLASRGVRHEWGDDLEPLKALRFGRHPGSSTPVSTQRVR
jgi:predicted nucleotidyltransferase